MGHKIKVLYRFMVKADERFLDGRSGGIYEREVWAEGKRDALTSYPDRGGRIRPVVLGARQVGGKKIVNEQEQG